MRVGGRRYKVIYGEKAGRTSSLIHKITFMGTDTYYISTGLCVNLDKIMSEGQKRNQAPEVGRESETPLSGVREGGGRWATSLPLTPWSNPVTEVHLFPL